MGTLCWLLLLTGVYPLWRAWLANRRTSLLQAVHWAMLAWVGWGVALAGAGQGSAAAVGTYLALCLTGCAGVAVLGARRPGVGAWNIVVAGLLAVDLLPLAEGLLTGETLQLSRLRVVCVAGTIAVGVLNYLPTRSAPAALVLLAGCTLEFLNLLAPPGSVRSRPIPAPVAGLALASVPWVAYVGLRRKGPAPSEFDRLWLAFRDRFGLVWAQRLREQFNRSAAHAGWPVILRWQGLRLTPGAPLPRPEVQEAMVAALRALRKRFGPEEQREPAERMTDS